MRARWRTVATLAFVAVLSVPAITSNNGVPLTSYDMYATPRSPETTFVVPVGIRSNGDVAELSSRTIAASSDPLIVETYLRREIQAGRQELLCTTIANRLSDSDIVSVEIRVERYRVDGFAAENPPVSSELVAICPVR